MNELNAGFERRFISNPTGMSLSNNLMYFKKVNNSNKVWNQIFGICVKGSLLTDMRALWLLTCWNIWWTKSERRYRSHRSFPKNSLWRHLWLLGFQIKSERRSESGDWSDNQPPGSFCWKCRRTRLVTWVPAEETCVHSGQNESQVLPSDDRPRWHRYDPNLMALIHFLPLNTEALICSSDQRKGRLKAPCHT